MHKQCALLALLPLLLSAAGCGRSATEATLRICTDGAAYQDIHTMTSAFMEEYPDIQVEIEQLPAVRVDIDENYRPILDTDSQAERAAALQRQRTALMAGSSEFDLYLVTGGASQYLDLNGGVLVEDPYSLMAAGVLADLSGAVEDGDAQNFLAGVFEAGQADGAQLFVPLRVATNGVIADAGAALSPRRAEFIGQMQTQYAGELAASGLGDLFALQALSYPVVNKAAGTIALYDENYAGAIAAVRELNALIGQDTAAQSPADALGSGALVSACTNPLLTGGYLAQELEGREETRELAFVPVPDETDGVTAEIVAYAFAPASSRNIEASTLFLRWLLSADAQGGGIPCFSPLGGGYPVRKGCAARTDGLERLGESFAASLTAYENRVTAGRFLTRYDFELLELVRSTRRSDGLDTALRELYEGWQLYLDE